MVGEAANLFTAAEGWTWVVIRVIPGAACSGEAAGLAAALCLEHGCAAKELSYDVLKVQGSRPHGGR